jgi:rhodanese-related sulfurtransferase
MKNSLFIKGIVIGVILLMSGPIIGSAITLEPINNIIKDEKIEGISYEKINFENYTNLTVEEVWELISDSSNGIQILIDVRTVGEYVTERIYTKSILEKPRLFSLQIMERNGILLNIFMSVYKDREIILYCRSSNRSFIATRLLIDNGFSGKIYNMLGGIKEWNAADLPTIKGLLPI